MTSQNAVDINNSEAFFAHRRGYCRCRFIIFHHMEEDVMNKTELIAAVAEKTGISKKDAEAAVKAVTDTIAAELVAGNKVQLVGFGTFEVSERPAREGRNPRTGETIKIAAAKNPKFKAGKALKDAVNVPKKKAAKKTAAKKPAAKKTTKKAAK